MSHLVRRALCLVSLFTLGGVATLGGCSAGAGDEGITGEDSDVQAEGVTGSLTVGTKLVATGNVNLRSKASTSSSILTVVPDGGEVILQAADPSNGFYKVSREGTIGWSSGKYYTIAPDQGTSGDIEVGSDLIATANVNLRSGPSTSNSILDVVNKGEHVTVQSATPSNGYYKVDHDGTVGWSKGSYYKPTGSVDPNPNPDPDPVDDGQPWTCTGSYATSKVSGGDYYSTSFGCWVDHNGTAHSDSGDNCIPYCLSQAKSDGLCAGMSGPECERETNWYVADAGRFGCLTRLKITSLKNGKSAVVVVLDAGPACFVEKKVSAGVLDMSSRVTEYLFGGQVGTADKAMVHVVEVPSSTPLGAQ